LSRSTFLLILLGAASWLGYVAALGLSDLRKNTIGFEIALFTAFALYLAASAFILRPHPHTPARPNSLPIIFLFAIAFRLTLLPSRPTLSDDMYRYVWDGRVQANGISPYQYPPKASEVDHLHKNDRSVWRYINRKEAITIYPPGAQIAYAIIWRIVGDSVTGFKAAFVIAELIGGVLLIRLLKHFGQPPERALIYLWSPLLIFEVAHAGHVDGLMLPLLIAAFWARVRERHWLLGLFIGAATMVKLFPIILLPALLPVEQFGKLLYNFRPALKTLAAFGSVAALCYLPYAIRDASPIGFLPQYFNENFNLGLARLLFEIARQIKIPEATLVNVATFGGLGVMGLGFVIKPAASRRESLARCMALIGWFTLFTQNLFAWYLLWLLPLIVLFIEPGKVFGFKLDSTMAWFIFTGTVAISYLFFIRWRVVAWGQVAEYAPLYALLIAAGLRSFWPAPIQHAPIGAIQNS